MMCRCLMALYAGIVTFGYLLLAGPWADVENRCDISPARIELGDILNREIADGMLGGVRCDALADSLPALAGYGGWKSSAYDPDERCWYLTGWIDDERVGCQRMSLTLWPIPESAGSRAWRFHLVCVSLLPAVPASVDIEGAWRSSDGHIRIVWTGSGGGGEESCNLRASLIAQKPEHGDSWQIAGVR
ncbi:MAG TPA: hypothetical protein PLU72_12730 [Candidatus Ozemobacteraceae bacterium]|nr:hypothetical protein [Candidatus Ozemobacteraceae bacterium]